jgi:CRISPR type IV-associated protein Csf3
MFKNLKVTFNLDGTGVYYDPYEPIMLDALLAAAVSRWHIHGEPPARDEEPFDIPLPVKKWHDGDVWGWHASALFPEGDTVESLQYWRKRFRQNRVELTNGSPNTTNGTYRDWNMPIPLLLVPKLIGYACGDIGRVRRELTRSIKYLGKKRAHGRGAVVGIAVEEVPEDLSIVRDGIAMRYIPDENGTRLVRPRPPYWNVVGREKCIEIGESLIYSKEENANIQRD